MKKPSLSDLSAKKPSAQAQEAPPETVSGQGKATAKSGAQPDGRKGVLIRVHPQGWRALKDLAAELTVASGNAVTMQSLIVDAVNELLQKHGRRPLA